MNCDSVELLPNPAFLIQSMRRIGYTLETALAANEKPRRSRRTGRAYIDRELISPR